MPTTVRAAWFPSDHPDDAGPRALLAAYVTTPQRGVEAGARSHDDAVITTLEENARQALVDRYAPVGAASRESSVCPRCGDAITDRDSDPSMMLGLVILVAANTFVVVALAAAIAWLLV